jgi:hypothetical protein
MSFIMMMAGGTFFWIQKKDEEIKNLTYTILGLRGQDDSFDATDHYKQLRFREDLSHLISKKFVNLKDETLKKKISKMEASFKITLGYVDIYIYNKNIFFSE